MNFLLKEITINTTALYHQINTIDLFFSQVANLSWLIKVHLNPTNAKPQCLVLAPFADTSSKKKSK